MDNARVTIGEAAKLTSTTPKAIRLYERKGLLAPAQRTPAGYRTYGADDLAVLRFIRQATAVGLRLDEVGHIIGLQRNGQQPCSTVTDLLDRRLADLDRTMADLEALRHTLARVRAQAEKAAHSGRKAVVCRVIESAPAPGSRGETRSTRKSAG